MDIVTEPNLLRFSEAWVLVAEGEKSALCRAGCFCKGGAWAHKEQEEIARMFQRKVPGRHTKLRFASCWQEENYTRVYVPSAPLTEH